MKKQIFYMGLALCLAACNEGPSQNEPGGPLADLPEWY